MVADSKIILTLISIRTQQHTILSPVRYLFVHCSACYVDRVSGESSNDRNDSSIRLSAWWYSSHLQPLGVAVVLLSDDTACRTKAQQMELHTYSGKGVALVILL